MEEHEEYQEGQEQKVKYCGWIGRTREASDIPGGGRVAARISGGGKGNAVAKGKEDQAEYLEEEKHCSIRKNIWRRRRNITCM